MASPFRGTLVNLRSYRASRFLSQPRNGMQAKLACRHESGDTAIVDEVGTGLGAIAGFGSSVGIA